VRVIPAIDVPEEIDARVAELGELEVEAIGLY